MIAKQTLVVATNNSGKLKELTDLLTPLAFKLVSQGELNIPVIEETGLSFVENAIIKARHAAQRSGCAALADDSGLEVDALQGAPGIYSARFAGATATDEKNNQELLWRLRDIPESQRTARFQCVIVFMRHSQDPTPLICQGTWEGSILLEPRGDQGFGYDPLFYVPAYQCSAAELARKIKNQISHRAQALRQLVERLKTYK